jgi:hypothetical protein
MTSISRLLATTVRRVSPALTPTLDAPRPWAAAAPPHLLRSRLADRRSPPAAADYPRPPRALPALPFEHVLVAHGEPVHARSDFVAALDREPWSG